VIQAGDVPTLAAAILLADRAVLHLAAVTVSTDMARRLAHGQLLPASLLAGVHPPPAPVPCRVYADESFLGIGELAPEGLRPLRLIDADRSRPRPVSS
jgi:hypothetical protein